MRRLLAGVLMAGLLIPNLAAASTFSAAALQQNLRASADATATFLSPLRDFLRCRLIPIFGPTPQDCVATEPIQSDSTALPLPSSPPSEPFEAPPTDRQHTSATVDPDTSFLQRQIDLLTSKLNSFLGNAAGPSPTVQNTYVSYSSSPAITYSSGGVGDSTLTGFSQGITREITQVRTDLSNAINGVGGTLDSYTSDGAIVLRDITPPATTTDLLYNDAGDLYWAGNVVAGGTTGTWGSNGTDVYRASGNVGIGTSTPASDLSISGTTGVNVFNAMSYGNGLTVSGGSAIVRCNRFLDRFVV